MLNLPANFHAIQSAVLPDSLEDSVLLLKANLSHLSASDREFAGDLCKKAAKYPPSDKQVYWIKRLLQRALGVEAKPEPAKLDVGNFQGVIALFLKAKQHLKYPKIVLQSAAGLPVVLALAGQNSKAPGTVNVSDGGPYGNNVWYGRVTPDGVFTQSLKGNAQDKNEVAALLKELGESPAQAAAKYGKLTGRCCFCNAKLTDEHSTAAGFGPTCADHYGLKEQWKKAAGILKEAS